MPAACQRCEVVFRPPHGVGTDVRWTMSDQDGTASAFADGLRRHPDGKPRCWWCGDDPDYVAYHDTEWAVPMRDDIAVFEKLCLEGFQAGLSWLTILRKREAFRRAFAGFDPDVVAGFGDDEVTALLADSTIVRNRAKIEATISNAHAFRRLADAGGSLSDLVWSFAPSPPPAPPQRPDDVPASTPASTAMSRTLKQHGFRFVGPTTCYAAMQALGLVDDHLAGCWRRAGPPSAA